MRVAVFRNGCPSRRTDCPSRTECALTDGAWRGVRVRRRLATSPDPLGLTTGGGGSGDSPHGTAPLTHQSGTTKPVTTGGTPNSVYTHVDPKTGKAVQNAVYDDKGQVVAHIDFKNHGKDPATKTEAVSGHGHTFSTPGDPSTGHGAGKTHYPPGSLPADYSQLPSGVQPHTPIGK
jgi:hypothetical protein